MNAFGADFDKTVRTIDNSIRPGIILSASEKFDFSLNFPLSTLIFSKNSRVDTERQKLIIQFWMNIGVQGAKPPEHQRTFKIITEK